MNKSLLLEDDDNNFSYSKTVNDGNNTSVLLNNEDEN